MAELPRPRLGEAFSLNLLQQNYTEKSKSQRQRTKHAGANALCGSCERVAVSTCGDKWTAAFEDLLLIIKFCQQ